MVPAAKDGQHGRSFRDRRVTGEWAGREAAVFWENPLGQKDFRIPDPPLSRGVLLRVRKGERTVLRRKEEL